MIDLSEITGDTLARDFVTWCAVYVGVLLFLGFMGRGARKSESLSDHFLAGRSLGFVVLLLTLFATQYSGNSLSGFPGQTYRQGLAYFMSVTFMVGIVAGYLLFVPTLFAQARKSQYITPNDYLRERFSNRYLHYAAVGIFVWTLANYMLAQLLALGHATAGLTDGRIPYEAGVVAGAAVILVYELLGGMRAVAWTDVLQGFILFVGLATVVALLMSTVGYPAEVIAKVATTDPAKVAPPTLQQCFIWFSTFLLLTLGGPLYPQALQRIYAARQLKTLRRALAVMAFLPLMAVTAVVFMGVVGIILHPGLNEVASDQVTFRVLGSLVEQKPVAYYPTLLVMVAVIAAIMSTADSCLLSISSILTRDLLGGHASIADADSSKSLMRRSLIISLGVMAVLAVIALSPVTTLWGLLVLKFEILIQLSPAFVLGTLHDKDHPRAFSSKEILAGLVLGLATIIVLMALGHRMVYGIHSGTVGVVANYGMVWLLRWWRLRRTPNRLVTPLLGSG
jgi:SSS family solute:Na+ symporter/sodium/pantothenate symporter